jgi:hypothetical protein
VVGPFSALEKRNPAFMWKGCRGCRCGDTGDHGNVKLEAPWREPKCGEMPSNIFCFGARLLQCPLGNLFTWAESRDRNSVDFRGESESKERPVVEESWQIEELWASICFTFVDSVNESTSWELQPTLPRHFTCPQRYPRYSSKLL